MSWVVAGVTTAATIYGANKASKAAKSAANTQAQSADKAAQVQWDMFNQTRQDQAPLRAGGLAAFNQYLANLGIGNSQIAAADPEQAYFMANPDVAASGMDAYDHYNRYGKAEGRTWGSVANPIGSGLSGQQTQQQAFDAFRNTPGYEWGMTQGVRALDSSAAASGGLFSGKAGKALAQFGQNYADQQGYTPYMNRLASAAGIGQTATSQLGQLGQSTAANVGQAYQNAGNARASGIANSANVWGSAAGQLGGIAGYAWGNRSPSTGASSPGWWGGGGWGGV